MELLVIRHAIAEDRDAFAHTGADDALRPLTVEGRRKMRRGAGGLRREVPELTLLASSPLVRAYETASIVAKEYRWGAVEIAEVFAPEVPIEGALGWVADVWHREDGRGAIAVVGHEPHLSSFVSMLVAGREEPFMALKKGGACLLALDRAPAPGSATLHWLATAGQLRDRAR